MKIIKLESSWHITWYIRNNEFIKVGYMSKGLRNKAFPAQPEKAKLLSRQRLDRWPGTDATMFYTNNKCDINRCSKDRHKKQCKRKILQI